MSRFLLSALVAITTSAFGAADKDFESLFGDRIRKARASTSTDDDLKTAGMLIDMAKDLKEEKELKILMYKNACELAVRVPAGQKLVFTATEILDTLDPKNAKQWREYRMNSYRTVYARASVKDKPRAGESYIYALVQTGDRLAAGGDGEEAHALYSRALTVAAAIRSKRKAEITEKIRNLASTIQKQKAFNELNDRLKKDPKDVNARESLIRLHLLENDDSVSAVKLVTTDIDKSMQEMLPLAAKAISTVSMEDCLKLAEWYNATAQTQNSQLRKAVAYRRAHDYYASFRSRYNKSDIKGLKAKIEQGSIAKKMESISVPLPKRKTLSVRKTVLRPPLGKGPVTGKLPAAGKDGWIDLMKTIDVKKHVIKGNWSILEGQLVSSSLSTRDARCMIPYTCSGSYDLEVAFTRSKGIHSVGVLFPVAGYPCMMMFSGWRGEISGLCHISGKDANANTSTVKPGTLTNGKRYTAIISVRKKGEEASIEVSLDGKPYTMWTGKPSVLSVSPIRGLTNPKFFGVSGFLNNTTFHSIRLRPLGEAAVTSAGKTGTVSVPSAGVLFETNRKTLAALQPRGNATIGAKEEIRIKRGAMIASKEISQAITASCMKSNELQVEATIYPNDTVQSGPARIVSLSTDGHNRNFTIGQEKNFLIMRLRTTKTGKNGTNPQVNLCQITPNRPHRIKVTYKAGVMRCTLNGKMVMETKKVQGDFSNWDLKHVLIIGDEYAEHRFWHGVVKDIRISSIVGN